MKEVTKEKVQQYTVYQAVDGTEFPNQEECAKYEESAKGVLLSKFQKLIVNDEHNEYSLFNGDPDHPVKAIAFNNGTDKDVVLQLYYIEHPWFLREEASDHRDKVTALIDRVYDNDDDLLLVGENCDGDIYFIGSRQELVNKLNNMDKKEEQA